MGSWDSVAAFEVEAASEALALTVTVTVTGPEASVLTLSLGARDADEACAVEELSLQGPPKMHGSVSVSADCDCVASPPVELEGCSSAVVEGFADGVGAEPNGSPFTSLNWWAGMSAVGIEPAALRLTLCCAVSARTLRTSQHVLLKGVVRIYSHKSRDGTTDDGLRCQDGKDCDLAEEHN